MSVLLRLLGTLAFTGILFFLSHSHTHAFQDSEQKSDTLKSVQKMSIAAEDLRSIFYRVDIDHRINVQIMDESLDRALDIIANSAQLNIIYRGDILAEKRVTLLEDNISVSEALTYVLDGTELEYMISRDGYLLIIRIDEEVEPIESQTQFSVQGTVIDSMDGGHLPGVNVVIQGTTVGTSTGLDGKFSLSVPDLQETVLIVSFVGYESQEVEVAGQTNLEVELAPAAIVGDELVVVGYGTMRQRDVTGSVMSVNAEQLSTVARSSVNQMMQGRVAGLNMITRTAQPGGGVNVNIRGAISPGGSNTPLYVIDGVPMTSYNSTVPGLDGYVPGLEGSNFEFRGGADLGFGGGIDRDPLSYLNPADIESITVMKDASAAAIYGSAAANGVILITTRGGRSGDLQVEYRGSYSVQAPKEYFPLLNERQFMEQQTRLSYDWYLYEHGLAPYGTNTTASVPFSPFYSQSDIAAAGEGTDWVDQVTRTGSIQEHNLVLSGGSDQTRLYGSFSFHDNQAILKNSAYRRYTARLNLDQTISDAIEFRLRMNVGQQDGQNATSGESTGGAEKFHMIEAATSVSPTIPVYNADGTYALHYNPLIMNPVSFLDIKDESRTNNLFMAPTVEVSFAENLIGTFTGQVDREGTTRGFYLPRSSNHALLSEGMAQKVEWNRSNYTGEGYVTWQNGFANSELSVMAGAGIYYANNEGFQMEAIGFFTDSFRDYNIGVAHDLNRSRLGSFRSDRTKVSQFMRVNYSYLDRYILTLVGRRDGSSIFAENHRYGFFPGVSAAWMLSEENFLRESDAVSELKIRLGYGQSGNETVLAGNTLQLYAPGNEYVIGTTLYSGVALDQIANPDLTWETVSTMNLGLDFGFFRNRLRGSLDLFHKSAFNLLQINPMPFNSPVGSVADNVGSTESYGVELSLNTLNVTTPVMNWSTDFNISWQEARWVERNPRVPLDPWVGEKDLLGTIYGVRSDGIIRSADEIPAHQPNANLGNVRYVDTNGDGELSNDDVTIIGNSIPKWRLGLRNEIGYRNFSMSVYLYGNLNYSRGNTYAPGPNELRVHGVPSNTTRNVTEVWSADNPTGTRPGVAPNPHSGDFGGGSDFNGGSDFSGGGDFNGGSDFNLYDASFLRLQDITFGYAIPRSMLANMGGIQGARLFLTVQNLGVITQYPGYDPEYTEANPYPDSYTTTMGIEIEF